MPKARIIKNINIRNKLGCSSLVGLSSQVYYLWVRLGAHSRVEHLKGASLEQAAPALLANNRLEKKGLPGTNTLAFYGHL